MLLQYVQAAQAALSPPALRAQVRHRAPVRPPDDVGLRGDHQLCRRAAPHVEHPPASVLVLGDGAGEGVDADTVARAPELRQHL